MLKIPENFEEYFFANSNKETAQKFNISTMTVWNWARKLNLKMKVGKYKDLLSIGLTDTQNEILIGSLLGDGTLTKVENERLSSFKEAHSPKQREYLFWKYENLKPFSNYFKKEIRKTTIKNIGNKISYTDTPHEMFVMKTIFHPIFTDLEKKWYARDKNNDYIFDDNGKRIKIVPEDIVITPLTLAVWFFDDGHRNEKDGQAYFSTQSFTFDECEFLVSKIKDLGILNCWVRNRYNKPEIGIGYSSYLDFINIVKLYIPDKCVDYKVDLTKLKNTNYRYLMNEEIAKKIISLYKNGMRQSDIAKILDFSESQISRFVLGKTYKEYQSFW